VDCLASISIQSAESQQKTDGIISGDRAWMMHAAVLTPEGPTSAGCEASSLDTSHVSEITQSAPAGQGPTKAHRIHLKHVIKQFRAVEKRLASFLGKHAGNFLELLADVRSKCKLTTPLLPCFTLLLESTDGRPFSYLQAGEVWGRLYCCATFR
jgi:hypothetical protein